MPGLNRDDRMRACHASNDSVTGDEPFNLRYGSTKAGSALSAEARQAAAGVADIKRPHLQM
jgi:hypothetical protein